MVRFFHSCRLAIVSLFARLLVLCICRLSRQAKKSEREGGQGRVYTTVGRHGQLLSINTVSGKYAKTSADRHRTRINRRTLAAFWTAGRPPSSARNSTALWLYDASAVRARVARCIDCTRNPSAIQRRPVSDFPCFGGRQTQLTPRQLVVAEIRIGPRGRRRRQVLNETHAQALTLPLFDIMLSIPFQTSSDAPRTQHCRHGALSCEGSMSGGAQLPPLSQRFVWPASGSPSPGVVCLRAYAVFVFLTAIVPRASCRSQDLPSCRGSGRGRVSSLDATTLTGISCETASEQRNVRNSRRQTGRQRETLRQ